jgi:hypothetical protein
VVFDGGNSAQNGSISEGNFGQRRDCFTAVSGAARRKKLTRPFKPMIQTSSAPSSK